MKILVNKDTKALFISLLAVMLTAATAIQLAVKGSIPLFIISVLAMGAVLTACYLYFQKQDRIMENAVAQINSYLDGDTNARIDCDDEGELYHMFHAVNNLTAVLNAHADNELREKEFLKNSISDISHQLKTPLTALNIYNGLMQDEAEDSAAIKEFAQLSEQELDRIEMLVQNLLKITKLDSGTVVLERHDENVADMMRDVELHFAYRAKQEHKEISLSGSDNISMFCDRAWMIEAIENIVKNALDHTKAGDWVYIQWSQFASIVQVVIKDNGSGIHPEDLNHIFKRFYRSRFSKDTQGIGLGLPLAKAIVEAHNGTIEVSSELGVGTTFTINFLIPTKL
jgi:hypothetical protein